ncbi:hypothetical protein V1477_002262 [Vespula maculifrons]|uniref:Uncharacterized protein n=1 Tax=Vespula maculifrons TaxID=7453 RepID=A0ABD2CW00_VESMC
MKREEEKWGRVKLVHPNNNNKGDRRTKGYNAIWKGLRKERRVACKKGVGPSECSRHSSLDPDLIGPRVGCILLLSGCRRHSAVLRSRTVSYVRIREREEEEEEEEGEGGGGGG